MSDEPEMLIDRRQLLLTAAGTSVGASVHVGASVPGRGLEG